LLTAPREKARAREERFLSDETKQTPGKEKEEKKKQSGCFSFRKGGKGRDGTRLIYKRRKSPSYPHTKSLPKKQKITKRERCLLNKKGGEKRGYLTTTTERSSLSHHLAERSRI